MIDTILSDIGLSRKDLAIRLKIKNRRYKIKAFNILWWLCVVFECAFGILFLCGIYILFCALPI